YRNLIRETVLEFSIRTKYGDLKWVEQSAVLIMEDNVAIGFQCIIKDITERRQMEDVLRKYEVELVQNQERLQSILDNTTSLIYVKDLEGRYLIANRQFKQVLNIGDRKIIGKTDFDFVDHAKAKYYKSTDDQVINSGKPVEIEEILEFPDGVHHLLIVKFPLFNARNEIYGISGIATDISDRVKQREELKEAKRIAENAKKLQEQFLANMSHEIRTPMNGIQGMTDLLLETPLNEDQRDFAFSIKKSAENLIVIINDILDFSKIKSGKLTIEKIDFDFNEVIENMKAVFRNILLEKGLKLGIFIDKDVPTSLNGDPFRLNQVLINIIGNAIKFTHTGGINVRIMTLERKGGAITLQIRISDTGIGIPSDKLSEIFDSFTQASAETSRKYGGSGLGLTITKQLIELQGGTISVESEVNVGSTFIINIPFHLSKAPVGRKDLMIPSKGPKTLLKGRRILVAEDNDINQKVIRKVLERVGGEVVVVGNGLEAINVLRNDTAFDLMIMDLQMPEMDGYQATHYIRKVMQLSIPAIAMTASALKGEKAKCLEIGMNDYLSKPFNFPQLYESIARILKDRPADPVPNNAEVHQYGKMVAGTHLFDLTQLEEMGDEEYLFEIISIFLKSLPEELDKMLVAATTHKSEEVYKIAHKLKSSSGIFKAKGLLA
ncbi:MAG: response regulator, partial [Bacteroidota bacterium]|nr:response regulator [Bacteroidota bacterium]